MEPDKIFVKLVERNEHEGEKWEFFIEGDGNEEALQLLQDKIKASEYVDDDDPDLELKGGYPERTVDILCNEGNEECSGYMERFQKVDGKLDVEKIRKMTPEEVTEALYKGGIYDFVSKG